MNAIRKIHLTLAAIATWCSTDPAAACAVCFGDPNSEMVQGAKAGIVVLVVVVYGVVMGMVGVAGMWFVRAKRLAAASAPPDETQDS